MATTIRDIDTLQQYLRGVSGRAGHHARNVKGVILALAGAIVLYKDEDVPLETRGEPGKMKNVLWVWMGGKRFALSYDHVAESIEIRKDSLRGKAVGRFDNATPLLDIRRLFRSLSKGQVSGRRVRAASE